MEIYSILIATCASFIAGIVDAIAGGGGTITMPVLLLLGLPPHIALGTNKLSSTTGTGAAAWTYLRGGVLKIGAYRWSVLLAGIGGVLGALLAHLIPAQEFEKIIGIAVILLSLYYLCSPRIGALTLAKSPAPHILPTACLGIGTYDGILGPGTGAFYNTALIKIQGLNFLEATAVTKVLNLMSNASALVIFLSLIHI